MDVTGTLMSEKQKDVASSNRSSQMSYLDLHTLFVIDLVHPLFVAQGRGPQLLGPRHGGTAASTSDSVVLFGGSAVARPRFFLGGKMCLDRSEGLSQTR